MATATPDDITLTALTALGLLFCSAAVPAPRQAVYVPIATTVPASMRRRHCPGLRYGRQFARRALDRQSVPTHKDRPPAAV